MSEYTGQGREGEEVWLLYYQHPNSLHTITVLTLTLRDMFVWSIRTDWTDISLQIFRQKYKFSYDTKIAELTIILWQNGETIFSLE